MQFQAQLSHRVKQTTTLRPLQQYALHILSMNNEQLQKEISNKLEENPLLEYDENYFDISRSDIFEKACGFCTSTQTLYDLLEEQLHYFQDKIPYDFGLYMIDILDANGYITQSISQLTNMFSYDEDEIEEFILQLQTFEPSGVFAKDLQECLLIQLCNQDPYDVLAIALVRDYIEDIAKGKWNELCSTLDIRKEQLHSALQNIRSLNPKPASHYDEKTVFAIPEARIFVQDNTIHIELLQPSIVLHITSSYTATQSSEVTQYIKEKTKDAKQFINVLHRRDETLIKILACITRQQTAYFLQHVALTPYTQKELANELHVHESTISRAIADKYIEFENRILPLSMFFTSSLHENQQSNPIMHRLYTIIKSEDQHAPYSDQSLANLLNQEGVEISRRTVAKYRDILRLPNAQMRKSI